MKTQPIRLNDGHDKRALSVHSVALATFRLLRQTGSKAAGLPAILQSCAKDISSAWEESRPKA